MYISNVRNLWNIWPGCTSGRVVITVGTTVTPVELERLGERVTPQTGRIEPDGPDRCVLTAGADDLDGMVVYLLSLGADLEVLEPLGLRDAVDRAVDRLRRAVGPQARG